MDFTGKYLRDYGILNPIASRWSAAGGRDDSISPIKAFVKAASLECVYQHM